MGTEFLIYAAIAAIVIGLVSAGASAYMTYQQGQTQKKAAKYNAELQENQALRNQQIANARAEDIRQRNRVMLAKGESEAAASGVDVGAPGTSPLAVLAYDAREGELDALRATWYGDVNAESNYANARMMKYQGRVGAYSGNWGAGTTLLSGLSSSGRSAAGAFSGYGGGGGGSVGSSPAQYEYGYF